MPLYASQAMTYPHFKRSALLVLSAVLTLSSCAQQGTPTPTRTATIERTALPGDIAQGERLHATAATLAPFGITLNLMDATRVQQDDVTYYTVATNHADLNVTVLAQGSLVLAVNLVRLDTTRITVTDLDTGAVTVARRQADQTVVAERFGFARLSTNLTDIVAQSPVTPSAQDALTTQAAALKQCAGSVPANLLQARAQAQNDLNSYSNQVGIAVAAQAAASAAVAVACGATVVTAGVSAPACIAAGASLAAAVLNVEDKTRQREDASIRVQYSQEAITQWKSDYAANNGCVWY